MIALFLLLLGTGVANAAVGDVITTLAGVSASKVYTIKAPRGKIVLNTAKTGIVSDYKSGGATENTGNYSTEEGADQWAVLPYKSGVLLYNPLKGEFLSPSGSFGSVASEAFLWSLKQASNPTGDYVFKFQDLAGANTLNNNNSGSWPCNSWSTEDDGNRLTFIEAGDFSGTVGEISWKVVDGDSNEKYSVAGAAIVGSTIGLTLPYAGLVIDPATVVVADGLNATSTYTVDEDALPFKYSSSFDNATWYRMTVRGGAKNCMFDGTNVKNSTDAIETLTDEYYFALVGDPFGYKLYNYTAGKNAPMGPATSDGNPRLAAAASADEGGTFIFEYSSAGNGFQLFRYADGELAYINDVSGFMGVWRTAGNRTDNGSDFRYIPAPTFAELTDLIAVFGDINATNSQGVYTAESAAAVSTAAKAAKRVRAKSGPAAIESAYNALEEAVNNLVAAEGYWTVGETAVMPEPGKMYAVQNAYNNTYLGANNGCTEKFGEVTNDNIWSVDATDNTTTDGYGTYVLKSIEKGGYWQYVNYGEQTWDESTPYDGYDWYGYAGTNADFGALATAQQITILSPTAGEDSRTSVGDSKEIVENSYVITAAETIMGKYFKLGTQNHPPMNVAFEPWREDVAWKFFEATFVNDLNGKLAKIIESYEDLPTEGSEDPGYYSNAVVAPFVAAKTAAEALLDSEDADAIRQAIADLDAAAAALKAAEVNPVVEGDYFIMSAYKGFYQTQGVEKALTVDPTLVGTATDYLRWGTFNNADKAQVFTLTKAASGNFILKNYATQEYVDAPANPTTYSQRVLMTADASAAAEHTFTPYTAAGIGIFDINSNKYVDNSYKYHFYHCESNAAGAGGSGIIVGWGAGADASWWTLRKVTQDDWDAMEQAELTETLKQALADASEQLGTIISYGQDAEGLINSDASNLTTNATSLDLAKLVNGTLAETTETWPSYPSGDAYLQVDLTGKETKDIYLTLAPRTGGYYKADTPKSWTVTASNDGQTWSYIDTRVTDGDRLAEGTLYTYPAIHLSDNYKYVRFTSPVAIENRTGRTSHFALGEFQLYKATSAQLGGVTGEAKANLEALIAEAQEKITNNTATNEDAVALKAAVAALNEAINSTDYWEIATTPATAVEAGKSYVLKNAYSNVYLAIGTGTVASVNPVAATPAIWTVEEVSGGVIDGNTAYVIKSEKAQGYWKYVNYGEKTWDATTPYDAYDWYNYAGFNGEFTNDLAEAQQFTILAPTATGDDSRTSVGGSKDLIENSFVVTAAETIMDKYFKIGIQNHEGVVNSALEPWREDVAWLFYEVTPADDAKAIQLALDYYALNLTPDQIGTAPGLYNTDKIAAYNDVRAAVEAIDVTTASETDIRLAIDNLAGAYDYAMEVNPMVDGYYFIILDNAKIAELGKETKAVYINTDRSETWWGKLDKNDLKFVFKITANGDEWNIQGAESGLYTGWGFYGEQDVNATLTPEFPATIISEGEGSFVIEANGGKRWCPKGNPNGDNDGPAALWGWGSNGPHGEASFRFEAVGDADLENMVNNALIDAVTEYKDKTFEVKDQPGYPVQANVDAFNEAYAAADDLGLASPVDAKLAAIQNLASAYVKANTEVVPIVDGAYYFIVNKGVAYQSNFGAPAAMYTAPKVVRESGRGSTVYFTTFDETNAHFIFKLTAKDGVANGFYAQNAVDDYYLNTGDGDTWYGEITTCTPDAVNAQLFKPYGVGQFFVADETDTNVSRVIRSSQTGTVYGWTQIGDNISEANMGYNAWELIPVSDNDAAPLIEAAKAADAAKEVSFTRLNDFATSMASRVAEYTAAGSQLSDDTKAAITAAAAEITAAITAYPYDIVTSADEYDEMLRNAEQTEVFLALSISAVSSYCKALNTQSIA